jgi:hypothetical protein
MIGRMARRLSHAPRIGLLLLLAGCGKKDEVVAPGDADAAAVADAGADAGAMVDGDPQVPPMGQKPIEAWLKAGYYQAWACEKDIFPPRKDPATGLNGSHGFHRICSNDQLIASTSGPYPVGAASVKELYRDGKAYGFAVGLKVAPGLGNHTWYWYERVGTLATLSPVADGIGDKTCGGDCHAHAVRDNVFVRAK